MSRSIISTPAVCGLGWCNRLNSRGAVTAAARALLGELARETGRPECVGVSRVFLTGGAGFIGSHIVDMLAPLGGGITIYDDLSNGKREYIEHHLKRSNVTFLQADILDRERLIAALAGHDLVWHLAANTDIIGSHHRPETDLHAGTVGTFNVLDAMRKTGVRDMLFASTGAVYGDMCYDSEVSETAGPLLPVSTYGSAKCR